MRIIARLNVGGPAQHVIHLTDRLRGNYPTLLVSGDTDANEVELDPGSIAPGISHYRIPELGRRIRPFQDVMAFLKLVRLLRQVRPEIVHTHTAKAGTLGRLAAWVTGVPVRVHTYHGHVFHGYFGRFGSSLVRLVEKWLARITTRIIAISESQAAEIADRFRICPRAKIEVVPLGLDLERFAAPDAMAVARFRRSVLGPGQKILITTVGRLEPVKNHRLLLEVARQLDAPHVVFALVGGGSEEETLRERAEELGVADRLRFLGWRSDLPVVYGASDIVVLTSINEGTPVCLLEALAAGKRVVSTDVGGVRDILQDGRLGRLVPSNRADLMAEEIARMILESHDAAARAASAKHVMNAFSINRLAADVSALYTRLRSRAAPIPSALPQSELTA